MTLPDSDSATTPAAPSPTIDPIPGEWQRVSPKYVVVDLLGVLISGVMLTVGAGIPWFLSGVQWLIVLPIFMFVLHALIAIFTPRRVRALVANHRDVIEDVRERGID